MISNKSHNVLYTGLTNNLQKRIYQHRNGLIEGFSKKYKTHKLLYFETFGDIELAIKREKEIKGWIREKKEKLIKSKNPDNNDLWFEINK